MNFIARQGACGLLKGLDFNVAIKVRFREAATAPACTQSCSLTGKLVLFKPRGSSARTSLTRDFIFGLEKKKRQQCQYYDQHWRNSSGDSFQLGTIKCLNLVIKKKTANETMQQPLV